jgi:hypothetical protein
MDVLDDMFLLTLAGLLVLVSVVVGVWLLSKWEKVWFTATFAPRAFYKFALLIWWTLVVIAIGIAAFFGLLQAGLGLILFWALVGTGLLGWLWVRARWISNKFLTFANDAGDTVVEVDGKGINQSIKLGGFTLTLLDKGTIKVRGKAGEIIGEGVAEVRRGVDRFKND